MPCGAAPTAFGTQHLLSVTTLALQPERVGLSDAALSDLGVAAMLHDVGYTRSTAAANEVAGARMLLPPAGIPRGKIRRLRATLEHHMPAEARPSLFAGSCASSTTTRPRRPRPGAPQLPRPRPGRDVGAAARCTIRI